MEVFPLMDEAHILTQDKELGYISNSTILKLNHQSD